jgi:hypothetical protein
MTAIQVPFATAAGILRDSGLEGFRISLQDGVHSLHSQIIVRVDISAVVAVAAVTILQNAETIAV